jgi:hypothetical protein
MVKISETPAIAPATNCMWNGSGTGGLETFAVGTVESTIEYIKR